MDASCTIQDGIHVFSLVHKYVSSILGTYQNERLIYKISRVIRAKCGAIRLRSALRAQGQHQIDV